jgi:hypothetical protein
MIDSIQNTFEDIYTSCCSMLDLDLCVNLIRIFVPKQKESNPTNITHHVKISASFIPNNLKEARNETINHIKQNSIPGASFFLPVVFCIAIINTMNSVISIPILNAPGHCYRSQTI